MQRFPNVEKRSTERGTAELRRATCRVPCASNLLLYWRGRYLHSISLPFPLISQCVFCCSCFLGGHSNFVRCCCRASDHMRHSAGIPEFRSLSASFRMPRPETRNCAKWLGPPTKKKKTKTKARAGPDQTAITPTRHNQNAKKKNTKTQTKKNERNTKTIAAKRTHVCGKQATKALTSKRIRAAKSTVHAEEGISKRLPRKRQPNASPSLPWILSIRHVDELWIQKLIAFHFLNIFDLKSYTKY